MASHPRSPFGFLLRRLRRSAGFTQAQLAARCHLRRESIGILERERRAPRRGTVAALAAALGLEGAARAQFAAAASPSAAVPALRDDPDVPCRGTGQDAGDRRATG
jgi:transcriptional regulator with XRE-family HTH domain